MLQDTLVQSAGTQTATYDKHRLLGGVKAKGADSILVADSRVEQLLTNGISRHHNLIGREEAFHAFIGYTNLGSLLG